MGLVALAGLVGLVALAGLVGLVALIGLVSRFGTWGPIADDEHCDHNL